MSDNAIVREYDERYQEAYITVNPFYELAAVDLRMYLGDQWDEKEKQKLFSEGRNALVFNYIRRNINLLTGYQRKNRMSSVVIPVEGADQLAADQMSQLLLYALNYGDGYRLISETFGGAVKTGFNLLDIWMDYRDDPINGDIKFGRTPFNGFIVDPNFTQLDFSDCAYVIKRKYLSAKQAASLLPGQEKDVYEIAKLGKARDDKFTWLPYQRQAETNDYVSYNEYYRQGWENVPMLVDEETGEYVEWQGDKEGLKFLLSKYPQLKTVERPRKYIECHVIVNETLMRTEKNQYGLNEYPFTPMVGMFESEAAEWSLKMQSLIRCQTDPQKEANKRRSQMIDILDTNINSGWTAKEDTVVNPRSLFQSSQGKVIWKKAHAQPGDLERLQPAQLPQGMFELQKQFDQDIMNIMGVNDAAFGMTDNAQESGLMMMIRQGASIVNMQDVIDNLRFAQKQISKKAVKLIQTWTPEKIRRILNQDPSPTLFDKDLVKYDIAVQEGVLTDTQRQIYFRQLVDLKQLGVPVTGQMLADAAPLQGKSEYNKQIAAIEQQQAQQAQQQAQVQQQILTSELEYNKASSIEKIAGSKERFTRAVANTGLETERSAKAIDDRAAATLDRVKAMKELESMDDDRIVKYMSIIRAFEEQSRRQEEQVKSEDVLISAEGNQLSGGDKAMPGREPL